MTISGPGIQIGVNSKIVILMIGTISFADCQDLLKSVRLYVANQDLFSKDLPHKTETKVRDDSLSTHTSTLSLHGTLSQLSNLERDVLDMEHQ